MFGSKRRSPPSTGTVAQKRGRDAEWDNLGDLDEWSYGWHTEQIDRDAYSTNPVDAPEAVPPVSIPSEDISRYPTHVQPAHQRPTAQPRPQPKLVVPPPAPATIPFSTGRVTPYPTHVGTVRPSLPPDLAMASTAPTARDLFQPEAAWPQNWPSADVGACVAQTLEQIVGLSRRSTPTPTANGSPAPIPAPHVASQVASQVASHPTPPPALTDPPSDPALATLRQRALMKHVLAPEDQPHSEADVRALSSNPDFWNHFRNWEARVLHAFWQPSHWHFDHTLCRRCKHTPRSVTANAVEVHDAMIWLCAPCQAWLWNVASNSAAIKHCSVRQRVEAILLEERAVRTDMPTPRVTFG